MSAISHPVNLPEVLQLQIRQAGAYWQLNFTLHLAWLCVTLLPAVTRLLRLLWRDQVTALLPDELYFFSHSLSLSLIRTNSRLSCLCWWQLSYLIKADRAMMFGDDHYVVGVNKQLSTMICSQSNVTELSWSADRCVIFLDWRLDVAHWGYFERTLFQVSPCKFVMAMRPLHV